MISLTNHDIIGTVSEGTALRDRMPDVVQAMQADYDAYAKRVGVLPMPAGYEPAKQIALNSLFNVWIPRFLAALPKVLLAVLVLWAVLVLLRRRSVR